MREPADILVAGAGPAGLVLALQAHDHGAVVRVIERRPDAVRPSRALILHARTLEVLRPLGVTQALLARADIAPTVDLHLGSRVPQIRSPIRCRTPPGLEARVRSGAAGPRATARL